MSNQKEVIENNERIERNSLLYPIAKSFFENHNDYDDIIATFDYSIDSFKNIIDKEHAVSEYVNISGTNEYVKYKIWFDNVRIYPPNSDEAYRFSLNGYLPTPNDCLAKMMDYTAVYVTDVHVELYSLVNSGDKKETLMCDPIVIPNGYRFNIPIPIFSKYCALRTYDYTTLIKSGEEMEAMYGYFIIGGKIRYILPLYKKPFNSPIVLSPHYDNQLARAEVIYTKGFDYEDSYYIVPALISDKSARIGRNATNASIPDYIFSLQMADKIMNKLVTSPNAPSSAKKELINAIPMRYMFYAFGCENDLELLKYICPLMNDFALIHSVRNSCLQGHVHKNVLNTANVSYKIINGIIMFDEPLNQNLALYIIGQVILSDDVKKNFAQQDSQYYMSNIISVTKKLLDEKFMPAVGKNCNIDRNKAVCVELGNLIRKLYFIGYQLEPSQSKTILYNRRIRSGQQVEHEFKAFHNSRLRDDVRRNIHKIIESNTKSNIIKLLTNQLPGYFNIMSNGVTKSLQKSFKGVNQQGKLKTDMITPKNINFIHGALREIVISTEMKGSTVSWEHRDVHQSEMFFICPTQTPESGKQTGRYKMPCVYTFLTLATETDKEIDFIQKHKYYSQEYTKQGMYTIKLNGSIIGYCNQYEEVETLYVDLLEARRLHKIHETTTIVLNNSLGILSLWCDIGRLVTYFVNVQKCFDIVKKYDTKNCKLNVSYNIKEEFKQWLKDCSTKVNMFEYGVEKGFVELFDSEMCSYNALVAPSMKEFLQNPGLYSHIALPNAIHGIVAGTMLCVNMSKGNRGTLATNHTKQAIGPNLRYPQLKYQTDSTILIAPQIPLAKTCVYNYKHVGENPYGQNVIIAFMVYKYNQEDSIILNKASAESGNFLEIDSSFTIVEKLEQDQEFCVPKNCNLIGNPDSYNKLNENTALPKRVGLRFYTKDALIGKITKTPNSNIVTDRSTLNVRPDGKLSNDINLKPVRSIVKNYIHDNDKGAKISSFSQFCSPVVGDKLNSEYCQKATIGKIIPASDMPYTSNGIRPDLIFNPPSIFSRETYGQLYAAMVMKVASLMGCSIDCTPYHTQRSTEELKELCKKIGIDDQGKEILYDPKTGKQYQCHIFIGNHYYERQPHLVDKKMNIRNHGPKDPITRMPTKGRRKLGGQSLDRMSSDSMLSSGIHAIRADEFLNKGSFIKVGVCTRCNAFNAFYDKNKNAWKCPNCGYHSEIEIKKVPHASNIIREIFQGLHIAIDYYQNGSENDDYKTLQLNNMIYPQHYVQKDYIN